MAALARDPVHEQARQPRRADPPRRLVTDHDLAGGGAVAVGRLAIHCHLPADAARWWVALISIPTVTRPRPACRAEPSEPGVSASTHDACPTSTSR
jgi:hypothetical protein